MAYGIKISTYQEQIFQTGIVIVGIGKSPVYLLAVRLYFLRLSDLDVIYNINSDYSYLAVSHCLYYNEYYNVCRLFWTWPKLAKVWFRLAGHMRDKTHSLMPKADDVVYEG